MSARYYDMNDFVSCEILPALGDYASNYDVEGIAYEVSHWDGHFLRVRPDVDFERFWEIVEKHELPEGGAEC